MSKEMLINVSAGEECRIALVENGKLEELYMERTSATSHVGNIYKGKVTNVEASIQAAFVDFGLGRNGFLHISDLMPQYFGGGNRHGPSNDEDMEPEAVGRKLSRRDRPPIQRCLRRGDEIIVQIIKEGIGTKGPTLSTYVSIPGRILVMMPGMAKFGISRKIEDEGERRRLRDILTKLEEVEGVGFILRTAGVGKNKTEIERDYKYLQRVWTDIEKKMKLNAPQELYTEGDLVTRTVRDVFTTDVERIVVDDKDVARRVKDFFKIVMPRTKNRVDLYEESVPLFHKYEIEHEIEQMYSRHVPLPSGGSLVIDQTEAVVAIDVNSGKNRDHSDAEKTAFMTDMEAADEIPRQLKLRDLGGVIICDFIDLRFERNRRELEEKLHDNFKRDRAKTKVLRMSQFGIIELTRQRMRPSLKRSIYSDCPHCKGAGLVKTSESMSLDVMRRLAIAAHDQKVMRVELTVNPEVGFYLLNKKRGPLVDLEAESQKKILIKQDATLALDESRLALFDSRDGLVYLESLDMSPQRDQQQSGGSNSSGGQRAQGGRNDRGGRQGGGNRGRDGGGRDGVRDGGRDGGRRDGGRRQGNAGQVPEREDAFEEARDAAASVDRNEDPDLVESGGDERSDERGAAEKAPPAKAAAPARGRGRGRGRGKKADEPETPAVEEAERERDGDADEEGGEERAERVEREPRGGGRDDEDDERDGDGDGEDEERESNVIEIEDGEEPMGDAPGAIEDDYHSRGRRDRGGRNARGGGGGGGGGDRGGRGGDRGDNRGSDRGGDRMNRGGDRGGGGEGGQRAPQQQQPRNPQQHQQPPRGQQRGGGGQSNSQQSRGASGSGGGGGGGRSQQPQSGQQRGSGQQPQRQPQGQAHQQNRRGGGGGGRQQPQPMSKRDQPRHPQSRGNVREPEPPPFDEHDEHLEPGPGNERLPDEIERDVPTTGGARGGRTGGGGAAGSGVSGGASVGGGTASGVTSGGGESDGSGGAEGDAQRKRRRRRGGRRHRERRERAAQRATLGGEAGPDGTSQPASASDRDSGGDRESRVDDRRDDDEDGETSGGQDRDGGSDVERGGRDDRSVQGERETRDDRDERDERTEPAEPKPLPELEAAPPEEVASPREAAEPKRSSPSSRRVASSSRRPPSGKPTAAAQRRQAAAAAKSAAAAEEGSASPAAAKTPTVKTGSSDKHLVDTSPVEDDAADEVDDVIGASEPAPKASPRRAPPSGGRRSPGYRDLDALPDYDE